MMPEEFAKKVSRALSSNPVNVFKMMPEEFAMLMEVFKKCLNEMFLSINISGGKSDALNGGSPGKSK